MGRFSHRRSPLATVAEDVPGFLSDVRRQEVLETRVVETDVGADRIAGFSEFFAGAVTDGDLATFAEENALVSATLRNDQAGMAVFRVEWLVATEDGRWRLVWP